MAEEERPQDQPSLELPSFSLRRRRRGRQEQPTEPLAEPVAEQPTEPAEPVAQQPAEPIAGPVAEQDVEPDEEWSDEPVADAVETPSHPPAAAEPAAPQPVAPEPIAPEPPTAVEPPAPRPVAVREPVEQPAVAVPQHDEPERAPEHRAPRGPRIPQLRRPGGLLAATLTGLVAGLGLVGLTWASLSSCGAVRGTTSCGGAAGYPLVALIFVVMVVVATVLLRLARVPEPTGTSLLGLGLTGVVALLFLADVLLDRSMVVVIPLVTAGTFALSHWVTSRVDSPARD